MAISVLRAPSGPSPSFGMAWLMSGRMPAPTHS